MSGDVILGYWSQDTSHSSSHHRNGNVISDDENIGLSVGGGRGGYRSLETRHSSSRIFEFIIVGIKLVTMAEVNILLKIPDNIPISPISATIAQQQSASQDTKRNPRQRTVSVDQRQSQQSLQPLD